MIKHKTTFSPLECELCTRTDCSYRNNYESLYQAGMQIKISYCKRLQDLKEKQRKQNQIARLYYE